MIQGEIIHLSLCTLYSAALEKNIQQCWGEFWGRNFCVAYMSSKGSIFKAKTENR